MCSNRIFITKCLALHDIPKYLRSSDLKGTGGYSLLAFFSCGLLDTCLGKKKGVSKMHISLDTLSG